MKKLWGGRFKKEMHPVLKCFSYSLAVDHELLEAELRVNAAWARMLARIRLITPREAAKLVRGLKSIAKDFGIPGGGKPFDLASFRNYEDVHTLIQSLLEKKAGAVAKKIHTARSRNDLVVTSTRIYLRDKLQFLDGKIKLTQKALVLCAEKAGGLIIPGMTHLRKAQPVLLAHHLLAYVEMLEEDRLRFLDAGKRVNILPLGSGALAGSGLPIDQKFLAKELGFAKIAANSLAAVADRGFMTEVLSGLAILWMHLSRLSEDFILWNSEPFHYLELDDAFATGSSLMPHKKNPDVFELIRGRSAVIFGHLQALLTLQKGLPLAYNRDLQEDKPALFDALRKTGSALEVLRLTVDSVSFNRDAIQTALDDEGLFATDVLEYLVKKKVPFSEAHEIVGRLVRQSLEISKPVREFSIKELKSFSPVFGPDLYDLLNPESSVRAKKTLGSTNPAFVKKEIKRWKLSLK